jgi:hypothetical protein
VALAALTAGSVLAAVAGSIAVMIVARVIQGIGGGVLLLAFGIIRDESIILWSIRGVIETTRGRAPDAWRRHLDILVAGLRSGPAPLAHQPLSQDNLDRVIAQA